MFIRKFLSKLIAFALITLASFVIFSISIMANIGEMFVRQSLNKRDELIIGKDTVSTFLAYISMLTRVVEQALHASHRLTYASSWGFTDEPLAHIIKLVVINLRFNWRHFKRVLQYVEWTMLLCQQNRFSQSASTFDLHSSYWRKKPLLFPFWILFDTKWGRYFSAWKDFVVAWEELVVAWEERYIIEFNPTNGPERGPPPMLLDDDDVNDDDDADSDEDDDGDDDNTILLSLETDSVRIHRRCTHLPMLFPPPRQR